MRLKVNPKGWAAGGAVLAGALVLPFLFATAPRAGASAGRHPTTSTTAATTTTLPSTTTTTTPTSAPLSDSGSANCASDGGTLIGDVCRLPDGQLHQQYETLISSSGGSGPTPFLFKVVAGTIPPGLQLPPDYAIGEHGTIIGGTPTARGTCSFTIQVTDGTGHTATGQFSLTIV